MKSSEHYLAIAHGIFDVWGLPIMLGLYYVGMAMLAFDGMLKQLMGVKRHRHSHLHKLIWQWHSGSHIHPFRSYGDESRLRKTASASNRATPEGAIVYWSKWKRRHRVLRNNAISTLFICFIYGLIADTEDTVIAMTSLLTILCCLVGSVLVRRIRRRILASAPREVTRKPIVKRSPVVAGPKLYAAGPEIREEKPKLIVSEGVGVPVMATLLAGQISCSAAETATLLKIEPDRGTLHLPDHFPALTPQRQTIEEIIAAQSPGNVSFTWSTSLSPRTLRWVPALTTLPSMVRFREYLDEIDKLPNDTFGVGLTVERNVFTVSHGGDNPWHVRSAGAGTGKSTSYQVKLAQVCHRDPNAHSYNIDTKQVSFYNMHGVPNVHIYDDPEAQMDRIWKCFYTLESVMRQRYTAMRRGEKTVEDFQDIWVFVDEGNDLAQQLKNYYDTKLRGATGPAAPPIWSQAIAPLIYLGRQVNIRGEFMFQNMTDRVLGGVSLRDGFSVRCMAGYSKNQFNRIVGTSPVPECRNGPGRVLICNGPSQTWVQGFYDDPNYLREYALAGRPEKG
jgi:hypothetical protein